jgi:hypothetical protein
VHAFNSEACHALASRETESLEVDQVDDESIERKLERFFKESVMALCKTMEDANLSSEF